MKKFCVALIVAGLALSTASPAFAIKQLKEAFEKQYAGEGVDAGFKALVDEAKCNICHVNKESKKKVHNPYGTVVKAALEKAEFPIKEFKKEPEKYAEQVKKIFEAVSGEKSGDTEDRTFAKRMEDHLLPGGNVDGKKE